nr:phosphatase PAP2 family protein [Marinomonas ostreistagni]
MLVGGLVLSLGGKYVFARPRPDIVESLTHVYTSSFPSGHATMSMVCFLGAALVFASLTKHQALQRLLVAVGLLSALLVGLSRIALGVHWPTDILGGWLLGALWVGSLFHINRKKLQS